MEIDSRVINTVERDGRPFIADDEHAMFTSWRKDHGVPEIPINVFPRMGIVASIDGQPSAAGWLYMDNSIGVAFVEWLTTRPGMSVSQSKAALGKVLDDLKGAAIDCGYGLILGYCAEPLARVAINSFGWTDMGSAGRAVAFPLSPTTH